MILASLFGSDYLVSVYLSLAAMDTQNRAMHINTVPSSELCTPACDAEQGKKWYLTYVYTVSGGIWS